MSKRAEELLRRMVEIPSVSGSEAELAEFLAAELPEWGFRTRIDDAGNLIAERGDPSGPTIMLVGHLDTVPGDLPVHQDGPLLYGRGTVDAKGPLATMVAAAAGLPAEGVHLVVAGVVEEETFGRGATHLARTWQPDALVVGEPNGWDGIAIGYKGRVLLRFAVDRPSVHTASPLEKAGEAAIRFWNTLSAYCASLPGERVFDRPVPTLVEFTATIEHAELTASVRTPPGFDLPAFEAALAQARQDGELAIEDRTPAVLVETGNLVVRALRTAVLGRGRRPRLKVKSGTSDLNILQPVWQVPAAVYGPGDSALDHTDREHIDLTEYATAVEVLREAIDLLARDLRGYPTLRPVPTTRQEVRP